MNKADTVSNWLAALPVKERARRLSKISHNLTIYAREFQLLPTSAEGKTEVIKKLLGLSELHHKLSAQVVHYCAGEEKTIYPEEVLSNILYEIAIQYGIVPLLNGAIQNAMTGSWIVSENGPENQSI